MRINIDQADRLRTKPAAPYEASSRTTFTSKPDPDPFRDLHASLQFPPPPLRLLRLFAANLRKPRFQPPKGSRGADVDNSRRADRRRTKTVATCESELPHNLHLQTGSGSVPRPSHIPTAPSTLAPPAPLRGQSAKAAVSAAKWIKARRRGSTKLPSLTCYAATPADPGNKKAAANSPRLEGNRRSVQ